MRRIVDGLMFQGKASPDRFTVRLHDLGNGQKEGVISRCIDWVEIGPIPLDVFGNPLLPTVTEDDEEDRRQANLERAARRAKTRVRRLCKALGVDCLLTLTYRANVTDEGTMKSHFKEFVRRVRRLIPGFAYVAAFERQKRGAWHTHIATHRFPKVLDWRGVKVKSYSVIRAIWLAVVGELGGNVDGQRAKPWHSPARLASYLSKYMLKAFDEGEAWSNRFSASQVGCIPKPVVMEFQHAALADLLALVHGEVCGSSEVESFFWLSTFRDTFYCASEPLSVIGHTPRPSGWGF